MKEENVTVEQIDVSEEHKERLISLNNYLVLRNSNFSIFYAHVIFRETFMPYLQRSNNVVVHWPNSGHLDITL